MPFVVDDILVATGVIGCLIKVSKYVKSPESVYQQALDLHAAATTMMAQVEPLLGIKERRVFKTHIDMVRSSLICLRLYDNSCWPTSLKLIYPTVAR